MDNPYHCKTHAADVLQTYHVILVKGGFLGTYLDPIRHLACYMAAASHDVEHEGLTNDYLINTESMLALRYAIHTHCTCPYIYMLACLFAFSSVSML